MAQVGTTTPKATAGVKGTGGGATAAATSQIRRANQNAQRGKMMLGPENPLLLPPPLVLKPLPVLAAAASLGGREGASPIEDPSLRSWRSNQA